MNRLINVDWAELKSISNSILDNSNELKRLNNELTNFIESVKSNWKGTDSDNYVNSCYKLKTQIESESSYLNVWSDFLSKSSGKYDDNVEAILNRLQSTNADLESME